jgi:hypothetical protein
MSKKTALILTAILVVLAAILLAVYLRKRVGPPSIEPPVTAPPAETDSTDLHAAFDLYLAGAIEGGDRVDRVELTLMKATVMRLDGKEFPVMDKAIGVALQGGVIQKAATAMIPAGDYTVMNLEFAPSGRIIAKDGTILPAFLPVTKLSASVGTKLPISRTLASLIVIPVDAVGTRNNAPIFTLPEKTAADSAVLGGIFMNVRSIGNVWTAETLDIETAVMQDLHIDLTRKTSQGSPGFVPATRGP